MDQTGHNFLKDEVMNLLRGNGRDTIGDGGTEVV